jgi:hypothetical protein
MVITVVRGALRSHRPLQRMLFHTLSLLEHRKDPFGATFGTGQTSMLECPFSHVHVDFFFSPLAPLSSLISCHPHHLALNNKTSLKLWHKTRHVFQSHSRSRRLSSFNFPFSYTYPSRVLEQRLPTQTAIMQQPHTLIIYVL